MRLIPGEVTALIGHNGAGKTTFLNQIVGLTRPDAGSIMYDGTDLIAHPAQARQICAIMPQVTSSLEGVTPRQAIATAVRIRGLKSKQAQRGGSGNSRYSRFRGLGRTGRGISFRAVSSA